MLKPLVSQLLAPDRREELAQRLDTAVVAATPAFQNDQELLRDLASSTRVQITALLSALSSADPIDEVRLPFETRQLARTLAVRGSDINVILLLFRTAQRFVIRTVAQVLEEADLPPGAGVPLVMDVWERTSMWISHTIEQLVAAHTAERERLLTGAVSLRSSLIRALLDEDPDNSQALGDPSGRLGYRMHRHHTAFVLHSSTHSNEDDLRRLDTLASVLAETLDARGLLTLPSGAHGLWGWAATTGPPDVAPLRGLRLPAGIQVGIGTSAPGLEGFRQTHREALAAMRMAAVSDTTAVSRLPTCYTDVEINALLTADTRAADALVARELGALRENTASMRRLRQTLHTYLRHNCNQEATSRALDVHSNTVRYRLQQIRELIGDDVEQRHLKLELALESLKG